MGAPGSPVAHAPPFVLVYEFDAASPAPVLRWTTLGMHTLLGYGSGALGPGWLMDAVHPDDVDRVLEGHHAALRGATELLEARFIAADGGTRHLRGELRPGDPLHPGAGGIAHWVDATAEHALRATLVRREQELVQARRLVIVGELASGIAHDCGNLLTAIRAYCDLLRPEMTTARLRDDLDSIARSADTAAALVRQLVSLGRFERGKPKLVSLDDLVVEAERVLIRLVHPGFTLRIDRGTAGLVHADPATLEHVLLNLVLSARDVMPAGGDIVIGTERTTLEAPLTRAGASVPAGDHAVVRVTFDRVAEGVTVRWTGVVSARDQAPDRGAAIDAEMSIVEPEPPIGISTAASLAARAGGHLVIDDPRDGPLVLRLLMPAVVGAGPVRVGDRAPEGR